MFNNFLNAGTIVNFLRNTADYQKIFLNILNSQEFKDFVNADLGLKYDSFKENLTIAFMNTEKSEFGLKKQQQIEETQKLSIYKDLAKSLIDEQGLSIYSAIILAAGFVGIEQNKVVDFLKSKGYTASKQKIENYYKTNEGFLKQCLKKKGKIIPGWNDEIESNDLDLSESETNNLIEIPDNKIEDELGIEEK